MYSQDTALLLVDLQNDFCPGGSLAVPRGDEVIPLANRLQPYFRHVIATKDWHPHAHSSFASQHPGHQAGDVKGVYGVRQVLWPDHCVQNSYGAEFHPDLETNRIETIIYKGTDEHVDSYSAFYDVKQLHSTHLSDYLTALKINELYILGLATDYCVKHSVLDAIGCGFKTTVVIDACRGVGLKAGDIDASIKEMLQAGAVIVTVKDVLAASQ